jgi:ribosomal protein S18 acetylase RimI-like enzyme
MKIIINNNPNQSELRNLWEKSFSEILKDETGYFIGELNQDTLSDWFDFEAFMNYLPQGKLIEARDDNNNLIGAGFIGKQHPLSWPDGHKAELFIIGVLPGTQEKGIGSQILLACEIAAKDFGAQSVVINAHSEQPQLHKFYEKNSYTIIGELHNYYANGSAIFFSKSL